MALDPARLSNEALARNFAEIHPAQTPAEALAESNRCLYCYDAPCIKACPTGIDIPSFIKKIASGNLSGAARVILDANPMGHSCARGCPVEVLCEGACVMNAQHKRPIDIGRLQRHATDHVFSRKLKLFEAGKANGKHVAVVGAGPAGLSCAQDLRRWGYAVTLYEAKDRVGGLNTDGIAQYKMRPETALAEAQTILDLGVTVKLKTAVGKSPTWAELERAHDAVFVAIGLGATGTLGVEGEGLDGVVEALTFIEGVKLRPRDTKVGRSVIVVGAGNTSIDCATQAKRMGAERVTIVYRRGEADMSAYDHEYELAKTDGVELRWFTVPTRVVGSKSVTGLECTVNGEKQTLACDMVIKAIGQTKRRDSLARIPGIELDATGRLLANPTTGQTSNPKFFAGGDCQNGGKEIVNAAAEGKRAARGIHAYLSGTSARHG